MSARERSGKRRPGSGEPDAVVRVCVDDVEHLVEIRWSALTLADREAARRALADVFQPDVADQLLAAAWVNLRRTVPDLDYQAMRESLTLADVVLEGGDAQRVADGVPLEADSPEV